MCLQTMIPDSLSHPLNLVSLPLMHPRDLSHPMISPSPRASLVRWTTAVGGHTMKSEWTFGTLQKGQVLCGRGLWCESLDFE